MGNSEMRICKKSAASWQFCSASSSGRSNACFALRQMQCALHECELLVGHLSSPPNLSHSKLLLKTQGTCHIGFCPSAFHQR
jgi:hypothetical protein